MIRKEINLNGTPAILTGSKGIINCRADFTSRMTALGFCDGLKAKGFAPRLLDNDGTWIVAMTTTTAEVTGLLR
jgi:hypothetical protein